MGILDFLFQGSPPSSVTTYGETTQDLPTWYSDYTQGLISRANAIAAEPYQAYTNPRIAQLDPAQQYAYDKTAGLEASYQPYMQSALQSTQQGASGSALGAASPFFAQGLAYNPSAAAAPLFGEAAGTLRQQIGDTSALAQPYLQQANALTNQGVQGTAGLAQPYFQQAGQAFGGALAGSQLAGLADTASLAQPYMQQAGNTFGSALSGTQAAGLADTASLAQPYMQQAAMLSGQGAQTGLGGIQDYMNPYTNEVVNRIGELGARNLREQFLPQIQDRAIQSGQFGGSRQGEAIGRALRDTQESTLAQQSQALQAGYGQAGQQLQADRARQLQAAGQQAQLGAQAAGLTAADYQRLLSSSGQQAQIGGQQAQLGAQAAGLTAADYQRLLASSGQQAQIGGQQAALGQTTAGLTAADYQRMLAGGQQQAALGQSAAGLEGADLARYAQAGSQLGALGQMTGQLAGQTGTQNLQAGQQIGTLANQDYTRQLQASQQFSNLGDQQQRLALQNIGALEAAGASQQQQAQRSLDQAYADFLSQREYDRNNTAFLNAAIRGLEIPTSTSTSSTGPASVYQPSPLSQLAQGAASVYGMNRLFNGK
jgi:hypothetical protein